MLIYPAIDIKDGKCVRLKQGKFDEITVFHDDPSAVAKGFQDAGASFIHVVDLDGARKGSGYNDETIKNIAKSVNIPIQVGGGVRNMEDVKNKLDLGVSRVILGTAAIKSPDFVLDGVATYGSKIAIGIDASSGKVAVEAWEEISDITAISLVSEMDKIGVKTIIYTDIACDGMMSGPNFTATKELSDIFSGQIIASGGVSSMGDLEKLQSLEIPGVIIGKALYKGSLALEEVIAKFERG